METTQMLEAYVGQKQALDDRKRAALPLTEQYSEENEQRRGGGGDNVLILMLEVTHEMVRMGAIDALEASSLNLLIDNEHPMIGKFPSHPSPVVCVCSLYPGCFPAVLPVCLLFASVRFSVFFCSDQGRLSMCSRWTVTWTN